MAFIAAAPRLGEILVSRKLIEPEDLERALELQRERNDRLGKIMVDMGLLAQRDLLAILAEQLGIPMAVIEGSGARAGATSARTPVPSSFNMSLRRQPAS